MKPQTSIVLSLFALAAAGSVTGDDSVASDANRASALSARAAAVRATADEMRFKTIPWNTDVFEGFRLAREEKRPVFLYMITGDPLDDC
jgi:hypothetical protein